MVRSVFAQPSTEEVWAQQRRFVAHLESGGLPDAVRHLQDTGPGPPAFTGFPKEHWRQTSSNNPQERLNW